MVHHRTLHADEMLWARIDSLEKLLERLKKLKRKKKEKEYGAKAMLETMWGLGEKEAEMEDEIKNIGK